MWATQKDEIATLAKRRCYTAMLARNDRSNKDNRYANWNQEYSDPRLWYPPHIHSYS